MRFGVWAFELRSLQEVRYSVAKDAAAQAAAALEAYVGGESVDDAERSRRELDRDQSTSTLLREQSVLHLVRDVAYGLEASEVHLSYVSIG